MITIYFLQVSESILVVPTFGERVGNWELTVFHNSKHSIFLLNHFFYIQRV